MYPNTEHFRKIAGIAVCLVSVLAGERAFSQVLTGAAAFGSWQDDKPGVRRLIRPQDLPPISKSANGAVQVVPIPTGARPQGLARFSAELVTSDLRNTRVIRVAPNGDLFVASTMSNSVHVLRVPAGSAKPQQISVFASGFFAPPGIAVYPLPPTPQYGYVTQQK